MHLDVWLPHRPIERVFERDIADAHDCRRYPCYFLFSPRNGARRPARYEGPDDDVEAVAAWLDKRGNFRLDPRSSYPRSAPGRLWKLDALLGTPDAARRIAEASEAYGADQRTFADFYAKASAKAAADPAYVAAETARLAQLLAGNTRMSNAKRKELEARVTIFGAFPLPQKATGVEGEL